MVGGSRQKERNVMIELVLAFVLVGPVERPIVGAPMRVAVNIVDAKPVRSVLHRVVKVRPFRRILVNRRPARRMVRFVVPRRYVVTR